jgi:hypothetical protein
MLGALAQSLNRVVGDHRYVVTVIYQNHLHPASFGSKWA